MTFVQLAASDHDPIGPELECLHNKLGFDPPRAHEPDYVDILRIFITINTCQICGCIGAPVA
jgi:hypothetical protein